MDHNLILATTAIVGTFEAEGHKFIAFVQSQDTIQTPHIHIGDFNSFPECREFHCILSLDASCDINGDFQQRVNPIQIQEFMRFLHSYDEDGDPVWRYILKTWNKNNSNNRLSLSTPIPNYSL